MITDREIAANIKREMRACGYTQRGLAAAIGMREATLSKILTGVRTLKATELEEIATALGINPDALLSTEV
jgi:transcriptional regulator with XRE-family HTH domain